jgi:hypothetical protein
MAKIRSQYIAGIETLSDEALIEALSATESHAIANVNWAEYPYKPSVDFHIAHSDKAIAIMFKVTEDHVKAVAMENNGRVWEDSCVEFFVRMADGQRYTNIEMNCAGTILVGKRLSKADAEHLSESEIATIRRITSLPHEQTDSRKAGQSWWAIEVIPYEIFGYEQKPGVLRANLYKCGDKCDQPHFLSWSPIPLPAPNFHCPEYFGEIVL